ncbi:MAG TPA: hypothetical protein VNF91_04765, partial [Candidatus Acidoferrum sp.]|nr:hypothetical protein [Candidatus Acidoferrum sp.]
MLPETELLLRDQASELVFGLVAPVGANLDLLEADLAQQLDAYGYTANHVRLSSFLHGIQGLGVVLKDAPEFDRVKTHMDAGNQLRERLGSGEILALWAMARIYEGRPVEKPERPRTAHILRSIKHPDEVQALRAVYGSGFFLIGLAASRHEKIKNLKKRGLTAPEAEALIERDAGEDDKFGQKTRDAFQLADVHIRQGSRNGEASHQLGRFLRLVFGVNDETPTKDEHAMFLAYASSARSGDLSRQVGAVLWRDNVGVLATGCNDVPAPGGGLYWAGPLDHRDRALGHDANERHKQQIAEDVAKRVKDDLKDQQNLSLDEEALAIVHAACLKTRLLDITEFGRAVHAEMDALLGCARAGISTEGATLFCTTFPCHNCAK